MARRRFAVGITVVGCLGLLLLGNLGQAYAKKEKQSEKSTAPVKVLKPTLTLELADEKTTAQEIGGVRVELTRVPIETTPMVNVSVLPRESAWETFTGVRIGDAAPVWIAVLPYYEVRPDSLQFKLRVTNHLGKVLKLQGVALQFTKDGETVPTDYAQNELNKQVVLPDKSWEGTLQGPSIELFGLKKHVVAKGDPTGQAGFVPKDGVLLVGLYDVVTAVDEASTALKRSNFEWIFSYRAASVVEDGEARRIKARLSQTQAQQIQGDFPPDKVPTLGANQ